MVVKGTWRSSAAVGIVTVTYPNGDIYAGEWSNGRVCSHALTLRYMRTHKPNHAAYIH